MRIILVTLVCCAAACGPTNGSFNLETGSAWFKPASQPSSGSNETAGSSRDDQAAVSETPAEPGPLERASAARAATKTPAKAKKSKRKASTHPAVTSNADGDRSSDVTPTAKPDDEDDLPEHGRANGVACTYDSDCRSDECSFGHCRGKDDKKGNGVECTFDSECESDDCSFSHCRGKDDKRGTGVACTFDSDCESDECSFNVCADSD